MSKYKNRSSNKSFGIVFFLVFFLIGIYPLLNSNDLRFWSLFLSLIFLILGLMNSKILTPLNRIWFKFGMLLGTIVSPIVMGVIFFFIVTPIGVIMKIIGKDLLNLRYSDKNTYWIKKSGTKSRMKNQF
jgi:predicted membrane metal-binding protein